MKAAGKRKKGTRFETKTANRLTESGIPTRRVLGSGAHGCYDERLRGDLQIGTLDGSDWLLTAECKSRGTSAGFKTIEGWLADNDLLFVKRDRQEPWAVVPWPIMVRLLQAYYEQEANK